MEKLKDYQVLDVLCGGTFYKVRHKVTNNIFAWKAYNCSTYSDEQIQNIVSEVKTTSKVISDNLLRYYDTILHTPSKTLYFVLEYNSWKSVHELIEICKATDNYIAENFLWYLLLELARVCKVVEDLDFVVLQKCITPQSIFVDESGELRINCFDLGRNCISDVMRQVGDVIHTLCYRSGATYDKIKEFHYSDDLRDVVNFLTDERNANLRPDVVLYHPTVLANLESLSGPKNLNEILVSADQTKSTSHLNKCDSEKAVELCRAIEPLPRSFNNIDSPIYSNISPKRNACKVIEPSRSSMSPTIAALALELPGFVPRSRKPISQAVEPYNCAQRITEDTLSHQWMSRLIALRQREESLNKRERELIAKEIINSPATKFIPLNDSLDYAKWEGEGESNGITLPPVVPQASEERGSSWVSRRRRPRTSSVRSRGRRKTFGYEDLDTSLSAGDDSMIITAKKITKDNMPRNIFPDLASKKVHFTSSNPFTESDDSVTLTFYELENVDGAGYQVPRQEEKVLKDITKFKYLDLEKITTEKRSAMQQWSQSPPKQAKMTKNIFNDITNSDALKKTPSKTSLNSKGSNSSRFSMVSLKSHTSSVDSGNNKVSDVPAPRTRSSMRLSIAPQPTTVVEPKKPKSRKSLLPFKTPFKFMTSTKI